MIKLFILLAVSLALASISQRTTQALRSSGRRYSVWNDPAYLLLVMILTFFAGLRTSYNDTANYITFFQSAPELPEFLSDAENWNPFTNPLFYFYESVIKTLTNDAQMLIFTSAAFSQICFLWFFKRYARNFRFSIFIYFTLGTFVFSLAAIKQVLGMAIATLAFPFLEKKQWGRYYLLIFLAMLVHTYVIAFAVLPFFMGRPWRAFTLVFVAVTAVLMMNFEAVLTAFMEQANDLGKTLADYEVFDDATINVFRLAVYAVPPLISFVFQKWVLRDSSPIENVFIHMSIISLAFMAMGTQAGANMFGRMGNYFELGTICILPTMLKKIFNERSYRLASAVASVCFAGFFIYANAIKMDFGQAYYAISIWQFIASLF